MDKEAVSEPGSDDVDLLPASSPSQFKEHARTENPQSPIYSREADVNLDQVEVRGLGGSKPAGGERREVKIVVMRKQRKVVAGG